MGKNSKSETTLSQKGATISTQAPVSIVKKSVTESGENSKNHFSINVTKSIDGYELNRARRNWFYSSQCRRHTSAIYFFAWIAVALLLKLANKKNFKV